jgi:hypothetical protein
MVWLRVVVDDGATVGLDTVAASGAAYAMAYGGGS